MNAREPCAAVRVGDWYLSVSFQYQARINLPVPSKSPPHKLAGMASFAFRLPGHCILAKEIAVAEGVRGATGTGSRIGHTGRSWPTPTMLRKTGIMLFHYAPRNVPLCSDYAPIMPHTNPHTKWNPHTNLHTNSAKVDATVEF